MRKTAYALIVCSLIASLLAGTPAPVAQADDEVIDPPATPVAARPPDEAFLQAVASGVEQYGQYLDGAGVTSSEATALVVDAIDWDGATLTYSVTGTLDPEALTAQAELQSSVDRAVTDLFLASSTGLPDVINYRLRVNGAPLFPEVAPLDTPVEAAEAQGIGGKTIVVNPGHGRYDSSPGNWVFQRGYHTGIVEDLINAELVMQLNGQLTASGAGTRPTRQLNKSAGNHSSGKPWWEMDAREYVRSLGVSSSVWQWTGSNSYNADIMTRPTYANYVAGNALVSIHNNGGGGCGTETWYDTANGYQTQSLQLANLVQTKLISRLKTQWNSSWCDRKVKGSASGYGENRYFKGPAIIVELAFMDNAGDNAALQNATFRRIATEAIRDAIVEYFGGGATTSCTSPTTGFCGAYFNNRYLSGNPTLTRTDSAISFDWGGASPAAGISADNFSVRWTGTRSLAAGRYTFIAAADDGVRVWLNGQVIIDAWRDQGTTEYRSTRDLTAGTYTIRMEYYENGGEAVARLRWEQISTGGGSSTNLALNRPAYATSQESSSHIPRYGNDGSTSSRWSSRQSTTLGTEWWWVDLGSRSFSRATIRWEAAYSAYYFLGWSNDGTNYTGYYFTTNAAGHYQYNLGNRTARYVGLAMITRAPRMQNYSFWELAVMNGTVQAAGDPESASDVVMLEPAGELSTLVRTEDAFAGPMPLYIPLVTQE